MTYKPFRIVVPFPESALFQNSRKCWRAKARAVQNARQVAQIKTMAWLASRGPIDPDATLIRFAFHPPHNRHDKLNLPEAMKAHVDGIARALHVNDKNWQPAAHIFMPPDKENPRVEIELLNPI